MISRSPQMARVDDWNQRVLTSYENVISKLMTCWVYFRKLHHFITQIAEKKNYFQTLNKLKREMTFMSDWSPEQYIWIDVTTLCSSETSNFFIIRSIYKAGNSSFIATITTAFVVQLFKSGFSSNFVHKSCLLYRAMARILYFLYSLLTINQYADWKQNDHVCVDI